MLEIRESMIIKPRRDPMALNILHVEDSPDFAELVSSTLRQVKPPWETPGEGRGYFSVTLATRLHHALRQLNRWSFDVVLLDLSLPDGSSEFTVQWGVSFAREVSVVVLTGDADQRLCRGAVDSGVEAFISTASLDRRRLPQILCGAIARHDSSHWH